MLISASAFQHKSVFTWYEEYYLNKTSPTINIRLFSLKIGIEAVWLCISIVPVLCNSLQLLKSQFLSLCMPVWLVISTSSPHFSWILPSSTLNSRPPFLILCMTTFLHIFLKLSVHLNIFMNLFLWFLFFPAQSLNPVLTPHFDSFKLPS